jgi:hypothetical protein
MQSLTYWQERCRAYAIPLAYVRSQGGGHYCLTTLTTHLDKLYADFGNAVQHTHKAMTALVAFLSTPSAGVSLNYHNGNNHRCSQRCAFFESGAVKGGKSGEGGGNPLGRSAVQPTVFRVGRTEGGKCGEGGGPVESVAQTPPSRLYHLWVARFG